MKKTGCLVLALILIFIFSACKKETAENYNSSVPDASSDTATSIIETPLYEEKTESIITSSSTTSVAQPSSNVPSSSQPKPVQSKPQQSSQVQSAPQASVPALKGTVTVSSNPKIMAQGKTYTGLPVLKPIQYTVNDIENSRGLSSARNGFSFGVAKNGQPHSITVENQKRFDNYALNALAWDNKTDKKVLYLTFDCGYKYLDLTERLLDTLKTKNVKAAFFCTLDYLEDDPNAVCRMISEGHIVGNHSTTHPDFTTISRKRMAEEILGANNYLRANYGYESRYFRFPTGAYSHSALDIVYQTKHRSVFWSVAYADWDPNAQQGTEKAYAQVTSRLHSGAVILLHSTSPDNVAILGRVIDYAVSQGYEFRTLDQYEYWK